MLCSSQADELELSCGFGTVPSPKGSQAQELGHWEANAAAFGCKSVIRRMFTAEGRSSESIQECLQVPFNFDL